jgi:hypothetical protein
MSGPKRNPDKLNTIGVVVVGICGAVLVYVTVIALQAFYLNDTSEIQTMADYGGTDTTAKSIRAAAITNITAVGSNPVAAPKEGEPAPQPTFHISIDDAMKLVVDGARVDPANLVPSQGRSDKATIQPIAGRPQPIAAPPAPAPAPVTPEGAPATPPAAPAPAPAAPAPAPAAPAPQTPAPAPTAPAPKGDAP